LRKILLPRSLKLVTRRFLSALLNWGGMLHAHEKPVSPPHLSGIVNTAITVVLLVLQGQSPTQIVDYKSDLGPVPIEVVVAAVIFLVVFALLLLDDWWS
jgi:hypothetical protein